MAELEQLVAKHLGDDGMAAVVAAFYRHVRSDDLLAPMYPDDDWDGSETRLRQFLAFRLLGDPTYLENRGHPRLRMRHAPFAIGEQERDRWLELMGRAMDEEQVESETRKALEDFFFQVADFMRNTS